MNSALGSSFPSEISRKLESRGVNARRAYFEVSLYGSKIICVDGQLSGRSISRIISRSRAKAADETSINSFVTLTLTGCERLATSLILSKIVIITFLKNISVNRKKNRLNYIFYHEEYVLETTLNMVFFERIQLLYDQVIVDDPMMDYIVEQSYSEQRIESNLSNFD